MLEKLWLRRNLSLYIFPVFWCLFVCIILFILFYFVLCVHVMFIPQEYMKLMGMKGSLYWAAWYLKFTIFMVISVVIMAFVFHIKIGGERGVITYGDRNVTLVFLLLYAISVMTFCFAISTFFSKGLISTVLDICA